jgi:hypothetical protein
MTMPDRLREAASFLDRIAVSPVATNYRVAATEHAEALRRTADEAEVMAAIINKAQSHE